MKLIIQPDDGLTPVLRAIRHARRAVDIAIFRCDREEVIEGLEAAVARGVNVRALIAHTNTGGEKSLRKLEARLLDAGATVSRTADDLPRYHGKLLIADGTLFVLGFNFTKLDIEKSRSFGIMTRDRRLVREATALFEADMARQPYDPNHDRLVVSPETSRELLAPFLRAARKELLIYDEKLTDDAIQRLLQQRARAGVVIRVLGKVEKDLAGIQVRKLESLRLHVRAIVRDRRIAFVGSQSLRRLELDRRREVGIIVPDAAIVRTLRLIFQSDWKKATPTA